MEILAMDDSLTREEDLKSAAVLLHEMKHENWCSEMMAQKMEKWNETHKAQFAENMK